MADIDDTRTPTRGSALVLVEDQRAALAAVLILQEMGYSVDIAVQPEAALDWIRLARYQWIVCSGGGEQHRSDSFALRLRHTAPQARILLVGSDGASLDALHEIGVEVLQAPVDVNMLVDTFAQEAA
jgi:DNA-binding response OmpR family regulator